MTSLGDAMRRIMAIIGVKHAPDPIADMERRSRRALSEVSQLAEILEHADPDQVAMLLRDVKGARLRKL